MSFPTYPKMKDSGVEWLGEVPEGWEILPLYSVASERYEKNSGMIEVNLLSLSYGKIIQKDIDSNDGLLPESFETYQIVYPGDIIWRLTDLQNDQRSLRTAIAEKKGMITSAYLATKPHGINSIYFSYLLRGYDIWKVFYSMGGGLRQSMKFSDVKRLPVVIPSLPEQTAIAAFLDRETAKIDALVEEQKRLIELLQEKRQAVISHAVTKGLDPNVRMKPSGIEWLGDVPEHWEVKAIWMLFALGRGRVLSHQDMANHVGLYPVYSSQTEHNGEMGRIDTYDFDGDYLTWTTDGANAGTVFKRSGRFNCTNVCGTLKPRSEVDLNFFEAILNAATQYFVRHDINPKLMNNVMSKIRLPAPTNNEQEEISRYIQNKTGHFNSLITEAQSAITLLQERRAALISAAVTGKIDVRGLVATEAQAEAA